MTIKEYLKLVNDYYADVEKNKNLKNQIEKYNKELIKEYPFLEMRNVFTDKPTNNFMFTWLDDMPEGWRIAFGKEICDELKQALIDYDNKNGTDMLHKYRIHQIKEKYGSLRWYDNGVTPEMSVIISKYEMMSEKICIICGEKAVYSTKGWISPYCEICSSEIYYNYNHIKNGTRNKSRKVKFENLFYTLKEEKDILESSEE